MKNRVFTFVFLLFSFISLGQQKITWDDLAKVKFVEKYYPEYGQNFLYPEFSKSVKDLEGKKVTMTGYFLNLDADQKIYILSKGPMSACFFCGTGGPETAVELHFKKDPNFRTDDIITITGILKLNSDDVEHFNYILNDCEAVKTK